MAGGVFIMKYAKYSWVGNRIECEDMERLYYLKQKVRKPITVLVAEAVKLYLKEAEKREGVSK
jgi:predicted DNA-binding protein